IETTGSLMEAIVEMALDWAHEASRIAIVRLPAMHPPVAEMAGSVLCKCGTHACLQSALSSGETQASAPASFAPRRAADFAETNSNGIYFSTFSSDIALKGVSLRHTRQPVHAE